MIHILALVLATSTIRHTMPVTRARAVEGPLTIDTTPRTARLYAMHGYIGADPKTNRFPLALRSGRIVQVDASYAISRGLTGPLFRGRAVTVNGYFDAAGILHAANVEFAEELPMYWPQDAPLNDPHSRTKADVRSSPGPS